MNCNKNVLILSYDFCLETGGIQNTSYLLTEELTKYANIYTICPSDGNAPNFLGSNSIKSRYANTPKEKRLFDKESIEIAENLHNQYTINYVLCLHYAFAKPAFFLQKKYHVPYGILTHGNEVMSISLNDLLKNPRSRIRQLFTRNRLLSNASQLFSNTDYTRGLVMKLCKNNNIYVVQPPVDIKNNSNLQHSKEKSKVLLSICRIVERKGIQFVIQALTIVIKQIPDLQYIIAGTGEYEKSLKSLVKKCNLEKHVQFIGQVSEESKHKLLSECGLFIMPSYMIKKAHQVEGFGVSFLEANNYGKFVISSRSGGIPEAIKENITGFLVDECDIEGIANAILRFYDDSFQYDPNDCIQWAQDHHISKIAKQYWDLISVII